MKAILLLVTWLWAGLLLGLAALLARCGPLWAAERATGCARRALQATERQARACNGFRKEM